MALTAAATVQTCTTICKVLGMSNPVVIVESPNKPNIKDVFQLNPGTLEEAFASLAKEVQCSRQHTEKTIIFCHSYDSCSSIYLFFRDRLGREMTDPVGAPDVAVYRMVDMYTACTRADVKNAILQSFTEVGSKLRIVIATIAFGMGLDCHDVRHIMHWGPSKDFEQYMQETGRAGCDGEHAKATLYHGSPDLDARHLDDSMKQYCSNKDVCRREMLMTHFGVFCAPRTVPFCLCCDICEAKCTCLNCT